MNNVYYKQNVNNVLIPFKIKTFCNLAMCKNDDKKFITLKDELI